MLFWLPLSCLHKLHPTAAACTPPHPTPPNFTCTHTAATCHPPPYTHTFDTPTLTCTLVVKLMPPLSFFLNAMLGGFLFRRMPKPSNSCSISCGGGDGGVLECQHWLGVCLFTQPAAQQALAATHPTPPLPSFLCVSGLWQPNNQLPALSPSPSPPRAGNIATINTTTTTPTPTLLCVSGLRQPNN